MLYYAIIHVLTSLLTHQVPSVQAVFNATPVAEFPNHEWLENLVVRSDHDNLLVTTADAPEVFLVLSTNANSSIAPQLIASIPNATSCSGIVELGMDVFYVIAGNFTYNPPTKPPTSVPGSYSLWEINLANYQNGTDISGIKTREVASLPDSIFLNGLTVLDADEGVILTGDSVAGKVYSINVHSGAVEKLWYDQYMTPSDGGSWKIGINGMKIVNITNDIFLYWSNSNTRSLHRTKIDPKKGTALQEQDSELLYAGNSTTLSPDDFTVDEAGAVWMANGGSHQVVRMKQEDGSWEMEVMVNDNRLAATAVVFGQTYGDFANGRMYVTDRHGWLVKVDVGQDPV